MNIGELFVNLGIKGTEKTVGALSTVSKGMGEIKSMSIEAKAGLIGAMYALERLFATSGQAGTSLTNFNALLGVTAQTLQRYQYAARQMGVSNQEVEGSFKALQSTVTKTLTGEGAPKGLPRLSLLTGAFGQNELLQMQQHPELLMQRLQQYAQREKNFGLRNEVLKSFGIGDNMIAALSRNAFTPGVLGRAPVYGDKEISSLNRANIAWENLGNKIEMAVGHFNAKHGGQLVQDISKITDQVVKLVEAFTALSEKLHVFQIIGKAFEGWAKIFGLATEGVDAITGAVNSPKKRAELGEHVLDFFKEMPGVLKAMMEDIAPQVSQAPASGSTQNNNVNMNLHFQHDGKDHKKTADSTKKAVQNAYRQISAQGQGS